MIIMMDNKKKTGCKVKNATLQNAKQSLPGQQMGLYGDDGKQDVKDMVKKMNPDSNSLNSRG